MILSTILQEKERIERMLVKYQEELGTLPKGTVSEKKVKQSTYFYLKYREGKKVISRYIPRKDVEAVREQVEKNLEQLKIKRLYNQLVLTTENALSYLRFVGTVPEEEF